MWTVPVDLEGRIVRVDLLEQNAVLLAPWSENVEPKSTRLILEAAIPVGNQQGQECFHLPLHNLEGSDDRKLSHSVVPRECLAS